MSGTQATGVTGLMTFDEIVQKVADRLNLTSADAITRIGEAVNDRYREVATTLGLATTARSVAVGFTLVDEPYMTFGDVDDGVQKIISVYDDSTTPPRMLDEYTFEDLRDLGKPVAGWPPKRYAIARSDAFSVTILMDVIPDEDDLELTADTLENTIVLSGSDLPLFPEDYHDLLVHGAMAVELYKMEKPQLAERREQQYEKRISDLRMFIAKSAWLDQYATKTHGRTWR